jgi:hypothetical protein
MAADWAYCRGWVWFISTASLLLSVGGLRAQENTDDLRDIVNKQSQQLEQQRQQMEALQQRLDNLSEGRNIQPVAAEANMQPPKTSDTPKSIQPPSGEKGQQRKEAGPGGVGAEGESGGGNAPPPADETGIRRVVESFLQEKPGAGMPSGVQTGFAAGQGFYIRSAPNPVYNNWFDQSRIPFELRIRGRIQNDYYFYKVTDNLNHLTGKRYEPEAGDFSQIEVKRLRLFWEGTAFNPNLRYQFQIDGNTRGLGGFQSNRVVETAGASTPAGSYGAPGIGSGVSPTAGGPASPIGGGDVVDHALRLFTAWVAYDIQFGPRGHGCGPECPDGTYVYHPVLTFICGKQQPFFGFTEILGSANAQFVDFAMADWFFDADDNNMLTAAGAQYRDFDDRLFATALLTNGNESQFPNTQMDRLPGFNFGFWYDIGGTWDPRTKRYQLYGFSTSDLDWSPNPVLRVGAAANLVPMDRRSIYGDIEQSRVLTATAAPNGTRLINLLDGVSSGPAGAHDVDKFDSFTYDSWASFHWRGFSLTNEWWVRQLTAFQTNPKGGNLILYQDGNGRNALFPGGNLIDVGMLLQGGYFVIPKKLEIVGRYSTIDGTSGSIDGNGKVLRTTGVPGVTGPVEIIQNAFRTFHQSNEYACGFNYFFYGQLVKWSSDFSVYQGGNPAAGGVSPAGYIAGVDGWMVRTQIQLAF